MARGACTFRQRDVEAAVRAVRAAGVEVERVEIGKDGKIVIITSRDNAAPAGAEGNEWDEGDR